MRQYPDYKYRPRRKPKPKKQGDASTESSSSQRHRTQSLNIHDIPRHRNAETERSGSAPVSVTFASPDGTPPSSPNESYNGMVSGSNRCMPSMSTKYPFVGSRFSFPPSDLRLDKVPQSAYVSPYQMKDRYCYSSSSQFPYTVYGRHGNFGNAAGMKSTYGCYAGGRYVTVNGRPVPDHSNEYIQPELIKDLVDIKREEFEQYIQPQTTFPPPRFYHDVASPPSSDTSEHNSVDIKSEICHSLTPKSEPCSPGYCDESSSLECGEYDANLPMISALINTSGRSHI